MPPPADTADTNAAGTCSDSRTADGTVEECPLRSRRVVTLRWDREETWCSENGPISGTTRNYPDGEVLTVEVKSRPDNLAVTSFTDSQVSSDAFGHPWDILELLPTGGPSWNDARQLIGSTSGVLTPDPMVVRFIPNVTRHAADHSVEYRKQDSTGSWVTVSVECLFDLEVRNYLLVIHGVIKYVRGWGKYRLLLGDATLAGGFTLFGATNHWGYRDTASGGFKYWNGTAFVNTPAGWTPTDSNHFGAAFYKSGSSWVFRDDTSRTWPEALPEWPANVYTGAGNQTATTLSTWRTQIDNMWSDKFDIKRVECRSTRTECCRYKTQCVSQFEEVDSYGDHVIVLTYVDVRSDSLLWAMGDTRAGLAPHEFGHHLGAPDEYAGVDTTQVGVNDSDGLANGVDSSSIMGSGMTTVKKRHYKGIVEVLAKLVRDQFSKTYTYRAEAKAANLASPIDTPVAPSSVSGGSSGAIIGAIIGGIIGAVAGAIIGFVASGGNPAGAVAGALAGGAAGALIGAGIGSLF